jgi:hypothetical protein
MSHNKTEQIAADNSFIDELNAVSAAYENKAAEWKQRKDAPAVNTEALAKSIAEKKSALTENKIIRK